MKGVQHTHCIFACLMYQWTWNTCAVLLWGLTLASNCIHGSVRPQHRIRARRQQIRLEWIRCGWSKTMVRQNNWPRIEQSRRTENNDVRDLQQLLDSRFANATTGDLRSQWHMPLAFCEFCWRKGLNNNSSAFALLLPIIGRPKSRQYAFACVENSLFWWILICHGGACSFRW